MKQTSNPAPKNNVSLLTPDEVAEALGITRRAVYDLANARRIVAVKVGRRLRFLQGDVTAYIEEIRGEARR